MNFLLATQAKVNKENLKKSDLIFIHPGYETDYPGFGTNIKCANWPGKQFAGYISIGETPPELKEDIQKYSLATLGTNDEFNSTIMDVRSIAWSSYLIERRVPNVIHKGCNLAFLDTADVVDDCIAKYPNEKFYECGVSLIKLISQKIPVIVNRGFAMLPAIIPFIKGILVESFLHTYDNGAYTDTSEDERASILNSLHILPVGFPVYIVDFFSPQQLKKAQKYKQIVEGYGFSYLATPVGFSGQSLV